MNSYDSSCEFSLLKYFQKTQPDKINLLSDILENTSLEFLIFVFLRRLLSGCIQVKGEMVSGRIENFQPSSCGSCPFLFIAEETVGCTRNCTGSWLAFCLGLFPAG